MLVKKLLRMERLSVYSIQVIAMLIWHYIAMYRHNHIVYSSTLKISGQYHANTVTDNVQCRCLKSNVVAAAVIASHERLTV